mmetsp:Transcript_20146/g.30529  ORF Transcript_20146/g.30529 Transcript_20146/m.30529 type:complete len:239 (+) Transcript_20146:1170-1886(+)
MHLTMRNIRKNYLLEQWYRIVLVKSTRMGVLMPVANHVKRAVRSLGKIRKDKIRPRYPMSRLTRMVLKIFANRINTRSTVNLVRFVWYMFTKRRVWDLPWHDTMQVSYGVVKHITSRQILICNSLWSGMKSIAMNSRLQRAHQRWYSHRTLLDFHRAMVIMSTSHLVQDSASVRPRWKIQTLSFVSILGLVTTEVKNIQRKFLSLQPDSSLLMRSFWWMCLLIPSSHGVSWVRRLHCP